MIWIILGCIPFALIAIAFILVADRGAWEALGMTFLTAGVLAAAVAAIVLGLEEIGVMRP